MQDKILILSMLMGICWAVEPRYLQGGAKNIWQAVCRMWYRLGCGAPWLLPFYKGRAESRFSHGACEWQTQKWNCAGHLQRAPTKSSCHLPMGYFTPFNILEEKCVIEVIEVIEEKCAWRRTKDSSIFSTVMIERCMGVKGGEGNW